MGVSGQRRVSNDLVTVRGIYDGKQVRLLEELKVPPETEGEVVVPEPSAAPDDESPEDEHWRRLRRVF